MAARSPREAVTPDQYRRLAKEDIERIGHIEAGYCTRNPGRSLVFENGSHQPQRGPMKIGDRRRMEAVPARACGTFRYRPPTAAGLDAFAAVWIHELPANPAGPIAVASDGTVDLQWVNGDFRVAGPDTEAAIEDLPSGTRIIGFRFRPGAAAAWLGTAVSNLTDRRVALESLWGPRARHAANSVPYEPDLERLVHYLEIIVGRMAPAFEGGDRKMRTAYHLTAGGPPPGAPLVPWLGRALGMTERTLRRRFDQVFGYGPKTLDRILRYQRYLRLAGSSRDSTARLALQAGYADQAHLNRESRRLTGSTAALMRQLAARWAPLDD